MKIIETNWNWNSSLIRRFSTKYIVLHHADAVSCSAEQIDASHKRSGWNGIGYHFYVRKDGSIYRGRPLEMTGAHVLGKNSVSVGICAEGDYSIEKEMPSAQKLSIAQLIDYIKTTFYPEAEIVGHGEIGASLCPGKYYPLEEMKNYKNILFQESEDLDMTLYEELKKEISELRSTVAKRTGYYNYIDENMNESYRPTIQKLVEEGIIQGNENGELMLTNDMMRVLVFADRMLKK